jgi:hypothetical protein
VIDASLICAPVTRADVVATAVPVSDTRSASIATTIAGVGIVSFTVIPPLVVNRFLDVAGGDAAPPRSRPGGAVS